MKAILLGLVAVLLLSFRPTNPVTIEIEGSPTCLKKNKEYTIRIVAPGELSDEDSFILSGIGISLSKADGEYTFRGRTSGSKSPVILSVSIRNNKKNTSEPVSRLEINVCN